jgi:hypothetical protein
MKKTCPFIAVLATVALICLLPASRGGADNQPDRPAPVSRFRFEFVLVVPQGDAEVAVVRNASVERLDGRAT